MQSQTERVNDLFGLPKCLSVSPCNTPRLLCCNGVITKQTRRRYVNTLETSTFPLLALSQIVKTSATYLGAAGYCRFEGETGFWQMTQLFDDAKRNLMTTTKHSNNRDNVAYADLLVLKG